MNEYLKAKLKTLPMLPGCYLMKDVHGTIIYVGKAKKLKNRVNSYFVGAHNYKTTKLVQNIVDFDYVVTSSEKEALLLEINLIKEHRPRYNIMMMDDKSYPYIRLTNEQLPTLRVVRDLKKKKNAKYFGPYPDVFAARKTYDLLMELFPFRRCEHIPKKECLYYHMGMCLGPCIHKIDESTYKQMCDSIIRVLKGDTREIEQELIEKRNRASDTLEFEKAAKYQQLIQSLQYVTAKQQIDYDTTKDIDAFAYYVDQGYIAMQGLFIRNGKLLEREFTCTPLVDEPNDMLESFVMQYYAIHPLPHMVLLPSEMDVAQLEEVLDTKIHQPIKGAYRKFLDMTLFNAKQQLVQKFQVQQHELLKYEQVMEQLSQLLGFTISRIEMFDNSHISGTDAVAGLVVFDDGKPNKQEYRHYQVHQGNNDVGNMKEVVYRRYFRLLSEQKRMPDLLLVDGGMMQIDAAKEVLDALQLQIPIYGLLKDDRHHTDALMDVNHNVIPIDKQQELFFFLTRVQDEVHRFAIVYHRKLRSKNQTQSSLTQIEGVGQARYKKLMKQFGSFKKIKEASLEELRSVVPNDVAHNIYNAIHDGCEDLEIKK